MSAPIDISKIKVGDEVTVRAVVKVQPTEKNWGLAFQHNQGGATHYVHPDAIATHTPKALAVGDRVTLARTNLYRGQCGSVSATEGRDAWVRLFDGSHVTVELSDLERVS